MSRYDFKYSCERGQSLPHILLYHSPDTITKFADCRTGEVRLADFTNSSEEDSRQGTVQICINNAWGSVCSDDFFDNTDAAVFCGQLSGFTSEGI